MSAKHSPLPWIFDKSQEVITDESGNWIAGTHCSRSLEPEQEDANAELLLRAVNSHDDLIDALKAAEDALQLSPEQFHEKHGWNVSELAERRRAAIEKAEP